MRTHGTEKRRSWTKLHIAINSDSQEILAAIVTGSDVHDGEVLADLLEQIPEGVKDGFGDLCPFEGTERMILTRTLNSYKAWAHWLPFHPGKMRLSLAMGLF